MTKILLSTKLPNPIPETLVSKLVFITIPCLKFWAQSPKFKKVSYPEFPFLDLNICVDFDFRDFNLIRKTRVSKLVFIKIPCLKFWVLYTVGKKGLVIAQIIEHNCLNKL